MKIQSTPICFALAFAFAALFACCFASCKESGNTIVGADYEPETNDSFKDESFEEAPITEDEEISSDETLIEEPEPEFDEEIESDEANIYDQELIESDGGEQEELLTISFRGFPWSGIEITTCPDTYPDNANYFTDVMWEDEDGTAYFVGLHFWKYADSPKETAVCDPRMTEGGLSVTGRKVNGSTEVWVGYKGGLARLALDEWTKFALPTEMLSQSSDEARNEVLDMEFVGETLVVLTRDKLGLFNSTTEEWNVPPDCQYKLDSTFGLTYDGSRLWGTSWLGLYIVDTVEGFCARYIDVPNPDGGAYAGILNADEEGALWIAVAAGGTLKTLLRFSNDFFTKINLPKPEEADYVAIGQGMGRWPLLYFETYYKYYDPAPFCPPELPPAKSDGCENKAIARILGSDGQIISGATTFDYHHNCTWGTQICQHPMVGPLAKTILNQRRVIYGKRHIWMNTFRDQGLGLTEIKIQ